MVERSRPSPAQDKQLAKAVRESKAPAISRAAAILRLLGKSDTPLGLQTIARTLGLVPSTCLYVLRALVAEEFVAFDKDTKRYSLEAGVLTLARGWRRLPIDQHPRPLCRRTIHRSVEPRIECRRRLSRNGAEAAKIVVGETRSDDKNAIPSQGRKRAPECEMLLWIVAMLQ